MTELPELPPHVKAVECRFAVHCRPADKYHPHDLHVIKERVHFQDGTSKPHLRLLYDFKRDYYIANKGARNHTQKKEWEHVSKLVRFESTQHQLRENVARSLGKPGFRGSMRDLSESPYLYGTDISSTAIIKQQYRDKWDIQTPYTVAVYDTETDVVYGTNEILMATISQKENVYTAIQKKFVAAYVDPIAQIKALAEEHLGPILKERNITLHIAIVDTEIDVVKATIAKAHEWKPDFLTFWNAIFDIRKIEEACARAGVNLADLFSDPSVPPEFRHYRLKEGPAKKVTQSGRVHNFKPAQRWHAVYAPASFYVVDSMCTYYYVRAGEPAEAHYSLNYLLKKKLGETYGKLKFKEADHVSGLEWHKLMQSKYPLHYVVYNIYDCVGVEMFDEKVKDVQMQLPMFAGATDFADFKSQPKRTVNELHFFVQKLKEPRILGTTGPEMRDDEDKLVTRTKGWITMLPSHLVDDNGLRIISENPWLATNIRIHVGDLDVAASYPNGETVLNISKETTCKELVSIEGIPEYTQRMATINFSGGRTNAVEISCNLFNLPTLDMWLTAFNNPELQEPSKLLHERQLNMLLVPHPESTLEEEEDEEQQMQQAA